MIFIFSIYLFYFILFLEEYDEEHIIKILRDLVQLYSTMHKSGTKNSKEGYENWFEENKPNSKNILSFLKKDTEKVKNYEFLVGNFHQRGFGVRKNDTKYFKWMEKGTHKDDILAYFELSKCYFTGRGVEKDNEKAYESLRRSIRMY